jgi:hypothetical protein
MLPRKMIPEINRLNRIAEWRKGRRERAMHDPHLAVNDPDRSKLLRLTDRYVEAVARGNGIVIGSVSTFRS